MSSNTAGQFVYYRHLFSCCQVTELSAVAMQSSLLVVCQNSDGTQISLLRLSCFGIGSLPYMVKPEPHTTATVMLRHIGLIADVIRQTRRKPGST